MIGLDTNVLVRFLVEDDDLQSRKAARLIERAVEKGGTLFVSDVTLCEVVWVLSVSYKVTRATIAATLRQLLRAKHLAYADSDLLARALSAFDKGKGDFADYVIREHGKKAGCDTIATFDRNLLREEFFSTP